MLTQDIKRKIDSARDILVGKVPDPKAQVEQITTALIYKFMDDMDKSTVEMGGKLSFFTNSYKKYAWTALMDSRLGNQERLNLYSEAIAKLSENPHIPQLFRDIFKNTFLPYRSPETLSLFLKQINEFTYDHSEDLGDAFEYLLSVLGSQGEAGQFRTPRHIIDFIVEVIDPTKNDRICDPACGTAGFLISAYTHIIRHNSSNFNPKAYASSFEKTSTNAASVEIQSDGMYRGDKLSQDEKKKLMNNFTGYDISPDMVRISKVNMYLHNFSNPIISEYDTLSSEEKWDDSFDVMLANPPFMTPKGGIKPHKRFSISANRAEVLFVDYILDHLRPNGRAGVIVPEGIIFQTATAYKALRKSLLENGLLAVISLPSGIFNPYAGVKTSILLIDKALAKKTKDLLFIKISNDGYDLGAQRRAINKNDLGTARKIFTKYKIALEKSKQLELNEDEKQIAHLVNREKITTSGDYNFSGEQYKEIVYVKHRKWPTTLIGNLIKTVIPPKKIFKSDFRTKGKYAIIDQSHNEIAGWTDDESALVISKKPLIIFGDHTCVVKYSESKFAQGADGIKILKTDNRILPKFLYFILKNRPLELEGYKRHFIKLKNRKIVLPPLEIQQKIIEQIEAKQKIIEHAKVVIQAIENEQRYFGEQLKKLDCKWVELQTICKKITDGTHKTPNYVEAGIPFLRVTDITGSNETKKYIALEEHIELTKRCKPEKGDVLYSKNGTIGIAKLINWDWDFSIFVSLALLKPDNLKINGKYLENFLNTDLALKQAMAHSKSGTVTNLHLVEIKKIKIPLPTLKIQKQLIEDMNKDKQVIAENKALIVRYREKINSILNEI